MRTTKSSAQSGIGHVLVVALVVVVFAAVGYIGYTLYAKPANKTADTAVTPSVSPAAELSAPAVNNASDLDKATAVLNEVDPSSANQGDAATLDTQLNAF